MMNTRQELDYAQFVDLVGKYPDGVVLIEGRRNIPEADAKMATALARHLALSFPELRFRSGNAEGADQAFSEGIAQVAASRLQIVAPYASHRRSVRYDDALYESPSSLCEVREEAIAYTTMTATPANKRLIEARKNPGRAAAKASYLIRDTMKVVGNAPQLEKPICGIFYVDPVNPLAGGTGHTIRVCFLEGVPVVFQKEWSTWLRKGSVC